MNLFSIGDIENLTNIKAHTIRIWEQRYGICRCKRKESSHRYYDDEDLKQILRIAWLYHKGHRISKIAGLSAEQIREQALGDGQRIDEPGMIINRMLEASIDFDDRSFLAALEDATSSLGFEKAVLSVVFPFLEKLGLFWLTGRMIPAQEHFACALITQKICVATDLLGEKISNASGRRVLVFTPTGEYHELPTLFMNYLLRKNQVDTVYMGKAVSIEVLREYCASHRVTELYFHLITNLTRYDIDSYLSELAEAFPNTPIYASGCSCEKSRTLPPNIQLLKEEAALLEFARG